MAVKKIIWGTFFAAVAMVACVMIYEDLFLDPGIYGGGVRCSSTLVIGHSRGSQYGIEWESYWIDHTGKLVIPYLPSPVGYKHHACAYVLVGELSFPLPLRPWVDGALALLAVGAMGWFFAFHRVPRHTQAHDASVSS